MKHLADIVEVERFFVNDYTQLGLKDVADVLTRTHSLAWVEWFHPQTQKRVADYLATLSPLLPLGLTFIDTPNLQERFYAAFRLHPKIALAWAAKNMMYPRGNLTPDAYLNRKYLAEVLYRNYKYLDYFDPALVRESYAWQDKELLLNKAFSSWVKSKGLTTKYCKQGDLPTGRLTIAFVCNDWVKDSRMYRAFARPLSRLAEHHKLVLISQSQHRKYPRPFSLALSVSSTPFKSGFDIDDAPLVQLKPDLVIIPDPYGSIVESVISSRRYAPVQAGCYYYPRSIGALEIDTHIGSSLIEDPAATLTLDKRTVLVDSAAFFYERLAEEPLVKERERRGQPLPLAVSLATPQRMSLTWARVLSHVATKHWGQISLQVNTEDRLANVPFIRKRLSGNKGTNKTKFPANIELLPALSSADRQRLLAIAEFTLDSFPESDPFSVLDSLYSETPVFGCMSPSVSSRISNLLVDTAMAFPYDTNEVELQHTLDKVVKSGTAGIASCIRLSNLEKVMDDKYLLVAVQAMQARNWSNT